MGDDFAERTIYEEWRKGRGRSKTDCLLGEVEDDCSMKITPPVALVLAFAVGHLTPCSARADFFGKIEPRLFQVANGKKADYKKSGQNG